MLDAWIRINADGTATVFTGKVELGQGILTALAQIAAEELDLPLARIAMISGDTGRTPNEGMTAGSQSVENAAPRCAWRRPRCARILLELAAPKLEMSADSLSVADGVISAANGKQDLLRRAGGHARSQARGDREVRPKPAGLHRIVGQSIPRFDIPAKVTGKAAYVQDMRLPGMVHGRVVRPPHYGATLESVDEAKARAMPRRHRGGARRLVPRRDRRARGAGGQGARGAGGRRQVEARARNCPIRPRIFAHLKSLPAKVEVIGVKQAPLLASAPKVLEATYTKPYMAHASIGPSAAVAEFKDDKLTVWTHTQGVFPLRAEIVKTLKLPPAAVRCIHTEGSGCYGHNGADDVALDAALLARARAGQPVKLQWMRDDEFAWEPYGPAMSMQAKASLDADGHIVDWNHELWSNSHSTRPQSTSGANVLAAWYLAEPQKMGPPTSPPQPAGGGDRNAIPLYDFPNQRVMHHFIQEMPIRVSALRTLGAYANVFASNPSWTSWRSRPAPIRSRSGLPT